MGNTETKFSIFDVDTRYTYLKKMRNVATNNYSSSHSPELLTVLNVQIKHIYSLHMVSTIIF